MLKLKLRMEAKGLWTGRSADNDKWSAHQHVRFGSRHDFCKRPRVLEFQPPRRVHFSRLFQVDANFRLSSCFSLRDIRSYFLRDKTKTTHIQLAPFPPSEEMGSKRYLDGRGDAGAT